MEYFLEHCGVTYGYIVSGEMITIYKDGKEIEKHDNNIKLLNLITDIIDLDKQILEAQQRIERKRG